MRVITLFLVFLLEKNKFIWYPPGHLTFSEAYINVVLITLLCGYISYGHAGFTYLLLHETIVHSLESLFDIYRGIWLLKELISIVKIVGVLSPYVELSPSTAMVCPIAFFPRNILLFLTTYSSTITWYKLNICCVVFTNINWGDVASYFPSQHYFATYSQMLFIFPSQHFIISHNLSADVASYLREKGATLNFASKKADDIIQSGELAVKAEERVCSSRFFFKYIFQTFLSSPPYAVSPPTFFFPLIYTHIFILYALRFIFILEEK